LGIAKASAARSLSERDEFRNLSPPDATSLIAFYDSVQGINDMVNGWINSQPTTDVNAWNVLMQTVQAQSDPWQECCAKILRGKAVRRVSPRGGDAAAAIGARGIFRESGASSAFEEARRVLKQEHLRANRYT
jgi:hypothetical protein